MQKNTRDNILDVAFSLIYVKGYNGTSTSMILNECAIPKGSLYHYFPSKKELAITVIKERIAPKMEVFFDCKRKENENGIDTIIRNLGKISKNEQLVIHGCPLNRLNQEMSALDEDFEREIDDIFQKINENFQSLLKQSNLKDNVDITSLSEFIITSVWGAMSLSPKQSTKARFASTVNHLINYLNSLKV